MISLGDHEVYVRSVPGEDGSPGNPGPDNPGPYSPSPDNPSPDNPSPYSPGPDSPGPDITELEYPGGEGDGARAEPALCVHGLEGSSRNWTDLMDVLRPWLACDALDLPGFGSSPPRPDGRYSVGALAQTVSALIERRGRGPVHLIGNSLGGAVSLKVAAARPGLVRTLTLISPALPDLRPRLDLLRFPLMAMPGVGTRLLRKVQAAMPPERRVAEVIATCYGDPTLFPPQRFAGEVDELTRRDSLEYAVAVLAGSVRALTAETLRIGRGTAWRDATRVTAPTLVIYGSRDRLVDARAAGRAAHAFSEARIVVLPHTGHVAMMEHPDQVAAEIGVLLASVKAGRAREFPLTPAG
jgi:pimeloyl-ACP methyl ester carboxylesterase